MRSLIGLARPANRRAPTVQASTGDAGVSWWDVITLGATLAPPSRDEAMSVPAVAAARKIICETIGQLDLLRIAGIERLDGFDPIATDPNPAMPRSVHYAWVAEDILFRGQCTLVALARDALGRPTRVRRVLPGQVVYTPTADAYNMPLGPVFYNGRQIPAQDVLVIPGMNEGILKYARDAIATARAFELAAKRFADVPVAMVDLHQTEGDDLTDPQIDALIDRWLEARSRSGVAYTSREVEAKTNGWNPRDLALNEARQQCALSIANACGIEPASISAQTPGSTLTYQNAQQVREGNWLNAIRNVATPIAEAFTTWCLDDGVVYRWDSDGYTRDSWAARVDTGVKGVGTLFTADEWRARENMGTMPDQPKQSNTPPSVSELEPATRPATAGVS